MAGQRDLNDSNRADCDTLPRLLALERCGPRGCKYLAWMILLPGGEVMTAAIAGPPHDVNLWPSLEAVLGHFGDDAYIDADPARHIEIDAVGAGNRLTRPGGINLPTAPAGVPV